MTPFRTSLADLLTTQTTDILEEYKQQLQLLDSPLLRDEVSRRQCLAHARHILDDTIDEIRHTEPATDHFGLARDIGASRAADGVHPGESLRAADALFRVTLGRLAGRLDPAEAATQTALVALTLNAVLIRALRPAADSYARLLLNRVHQAQVDERRRLSRELHDRIGHGISVASRSLELYDIYREAEPARAAARVEIAQQVLHETVDAVRQVISDLRLVEPLESLEKAIRLFLDMATGPGLTSHVEVNGDEVWAPTEVIEETFLIVREALRNVVVHADARRVLVRIDIAPDELRASVADDGRGFDPGERDRDGTGVLSMRERAAALGGKVRVTSQPGRGTEVELVVPLDRDEAR